MKVGSSARERENGLLISGVFLQLSFNGSLRTLCLPQPRMLIPTHKYHKFSLPSRPYCCKGIVGGVGVRHFSLKKREINASRFDKKSFHLVATAAGFSCISSEDMPGFFQF